VAPPVAYLKKKNYFHLTFTFHIALSSLSTFGAIIPAVDLEQTIVLAFVLLLRYLPGVQVTLVLHQADPCPEYLFFNIVLTSYANHLQLDMNVLSKL